MTLRNKVLLSFGAVMIAASAAPAFADSWGVSFGYGHRARCYPAYPVRTYAYYDDPVVAYSDCASDVVVYDAPAARVVYRDYAPAVVYRDYPRYYHSTYYAGASYRAYRPGYHVGFSYGHYDRGHSYRSRGYSAHVRVHR